MERDVNQDAGKRWVKMCRIGSCGLSKKSIGPSEKSQSAFLPVEKGVQSMTFLVKYPCNHFFLCFRKARKKLLFFPFVFW